MPTHRRDKSIILNNYTYTYYTENTQLYIYCCDGFYIPLGFRISQERCTRWGGLCPHHDYGVVIIPIDRFYYAVYK